MITTKKGAYDELERWLLILSQKGCFCCREESGAYQGGEFKEDRTIFGGSSEAFRNMWVDEGMITVKDDPR